MSSACSHPSTHPIGDGEWWCGNCEQTWTPTPEQTAAAEATLAGHGGWRFRLATWLDRRPVPHGLRGALIRWACAR
jgi:hypothetical protein